MKTKIAGLLFTILIISQITSAQTWKELTTVEDICAAYPAEMEKMLAEFDLDYPGMEKVASAWKSGQLVKACKQLLEYYRNSDNAQQYRKVLPENSEQRVADADTILKNVFVIQNVRGQVPWDDDGHRDWYYKGPNNDREWAWLSNRHSQLLQVFRVYFDTGNPDYARYIDLFLRDFIIKSMPYPAQKGSGSIWRGLEVSFRAKVWTQIFYGMMNSEYLTSATRLLMLESLPDHAHYNRNFHGGNNWLTMEISALATVATNFPEYKNADEWLDYSVGAMVESMHDQIYPDGVQTELTSHYHNVSLSNFELFQNICLEAEKPLPAYFNSTIEAMYAYVAHAVRPDGNRILNNDGDRGSDRDRILKGAKTYKRPDWEYVTTNGEAGKKPNDGPSYFFPWAGQLISRSGFDADAHWSFFDIGPWGSGHQHNDKLHLSISAFGRDLLVDAGRFAYTGEVAEKFRPYARGTQGHNCVLIDGNGQAPGPLLADKPLDETHFKITPQFDFACGSMDRFQQTENVKHSRSLLYVRGNFWVVVDNVETNKPRKIETVWHFHPDCEILKESKGLISTKNEKGNLRIVPVQKSDWEVNFVKGQETPEIQGWYSEEYNKYEPNTAAIYSTKIETDATFVWLLVPSELVPPLLEAKVVSKNENEIRLEVLDRNKGKWQLSIPFADSKNAQLLFSPKLK